MNTLNQNYDAAELAQKTIDQPKDLSQLQSEQFTAGLVQGILNVAQSDKLRREIAARSF